MNIVQLLQQADVWIDRDGAEHRLVDMEPQYCANVVRFLRRNSTGIAFAASFALCRIGLPDPDTNAYASVSAGIDAQQHAMTENPTRWLNATPLVCALVARADGEVE